MSEIERLRALARYASERDRVVYVPEATALAGRWRGIHSAKQGEALLVEPRSPGKPRRASWRRWLARSFFSGLIIDGLFVGTNRSLNVGLTSSDYVSFAQIGALLYGALALAVLARWVRRLE